VIGGKLTDYRGISEEVTDKVCKELGVKSRSATALKNLPGADVGVLEGARRDGKGIASRFDINERTLTHLIALYGSRYAEVLEYVQKNPSLRRTLCPHNPDIEAEIPHAIEHESARTLSDFMLRRSLIAYKECEGLDCCGTIAAQMGEILGWNEEEISSEIDRYKKEIHSRHEYETDA